MHRFTDCIINVKKDLSEPQPLLLDSKTGDFVFPPSSDGEIEFARGENIKLYCSRGFRAPFNANQSLIASCIAGRQFKVGKNVVDFSKFVCTESSVHSLRRTNNHCSGGVIAEIGFQTDQKWLHLMRICHNESVASTHWVQYKQLPSNRGYQHLDRKPSFKQGDFYEGICYARDKFKSFEIQTRKCTEAFPGVSFTFSFFLIHSLFFILQGLK